MTFAARFGTGIRGLLTAGLVTAGASLPALPQNLPMPVFHHVHINSIDPERSLTWYSTYWPTGRRTTVAGFPAFQGSDDVYLLYTRVAQQAPGAFDKQLHRSVPQSTFWMFGSSVADPAGTVERLMKLDPKAFEFQPIFADPDDMTGVIRSSLAPHGDQLMTLSQLRARQEREKNTPPQPRTGRGGFAYLVDPDGMLVEFVGPAKDNFWEHIQFWHEQPLCTANWYVDHLGMQFPLVFLNTAGVTTQIEGKKWDPCDVPIGEVSYPTFMPQGQFRIPMGRVRFVNGGWLAYPRQCQNAHCGTGTDQPLTPSAGQVVDHLALAYPNLDDVIAHLKSTGVSIDRGPYPFGSTRAIMIHDPDGLSLELIEVPR
jgi:catechol 2,3-dioxygenase-like lactoylglutathione lyase family enzyme